MRLAASALAWVVLASAIGCGKLRPREDASTASPAPAAASAVPAGSAAFTPANPDGGAIEAPSTPPPGYVRMTVLGLTPAPSGGAAVFLVHDEKTVVPIFVGGT